MTTVCTKTSYSTEHFALEHIAIIAKKSQRQESPKNAYLCKKCNTWHITKQESTENLKAQLAETKELLKSREDELFKARIALKNLENSRNNSLGTNEFQIKIRLLEKELIDVKAKSGSNGKKFSEASGKLSSIKNILNNATKNKYTLEELILKLKQKI